MDYQWRPEVWKMIALSGVSAAITFGAGLILFVRQDLNHFSPALRGFGHHAAKSTSRQLQHARIARRELALAFDHFTREQIAADARADVHELHAWRCDSAETEIRHAR